MKKAPLAAGIIGACLWLAAPVQAAGPAGDHRRIETVPPGTEWIAGRGARFPSRVTASPSSAIANRSASGLAAPNQRSTSSWRERRHGPVSLFRHLYGAGVPVDPEAMKDPQAALVTARSVLEAHRHLLPTGVGITDLEVWANTLERGTRLVSFRQYIDGARVLAASAFVAMKQGNLVMIGIRLFPTDDAPAPGSLSRAAARTRAITTFAERGITAQAGLPERVIFPVVSDDQILLLPAYAVELRSTGARFTAYVDQRRDALIALRDERRFLTTEIALEHHDRDPLGGFIESPAPHIQVDTPAGSLYSDADGHLELSESEAFDIALQGRHVRVVNLAGVELQTRVDPALTGQRFVWGGDGSEAQQAQLDAYRFVAVARAHAAAMSPNVAWLDRSLRVNVNYDDVCNAWFDGELTFLQEGEYGGERCYNSAMVADIVYHEYGHGFHMGSAVAGVATLDEAVSEGFADYFAASITGDPALAPNFTQGGGVLRDLRTVRAWPDDAGYDPHETGLIVGGALWTLRSHLIDELGEAPGIAVANAIFSGAMRTASDVPSLYEAAILADDDNGDLADGTPHRCTIEAAFSRHGLLGVTAPLLRIAGIPPTRAAAELPTTIEVHAAIPSDGCGAAIVGEARLLYSDDNGATWSATGMSREEETAEGILARGELPGMPAGRQRLYRVEIDEPVSGDTVSWPANPAEPFYRLYVGPLEEIVCDDFEEERSGWSHTLLAGNSAEGADDWQRGTPGGAGGDPDHAFSGLSAWGNDLAPASDWDGRYQANKRNALDSPTWDTSGAGGVRLQFRRWLNVEDGRFDHARVYVNDTVIWSNPEGTGDLHLEDREWVLFDADITDLASTDGTAQIRWEIESDGGLEFGGWNIDDVCLYRMVEPPAGETDPPLGNTENQDTGGVAGRLLGCGCAQSGLPGAAAGGLVLMLLGGRRTRGRAGRRAT